MKKIENPVKKCLAGRCWLRWLNAGVKLKQAFLYDFFSLSLIQ
jgi:hypothetical protein